MVQLIEQQVAKAKENTDHDSKVLEAAEKSADEDPSVEAFNAPQRNTGW